MFRAVYTNGEPKCSNWSGFESQNVFSSQPWLISNEMEYEYLLSSEIPFFYCMGFFLNPNGKNLRCQGKTRQDQNPAGSVYTHSSITNGEIIFYQLFGCSDAV